MSPDSFGCILFKSFSFLSLPLELRCFRRRQPTNNGLWWWYWWSLLLICCGTLRRWWAGSPGRIWLLIGSHVLRHNPSEPHDWWDAECCRPRHRLGPSDWLAMPRRLCQKYHPNLDFQNHIEIDDKRQERQQSGEGVNNGVASAALRIASAPRRQLARYES